MSYKRDTLLQNTISNNSNDFDIVPVEHREDVLGVVEGADVLVMPAVDDGHGLQAQALHVHLRGQQEPE